MNRWLLFGGDDYYPQGGAYDLIGSFPSKKKAKEEAKRRLALSTFVEDSIEWYNILDTLEGDE